jgi:hypothetical protein
MSSAKPVKLVAQEPWPPRNLTHEEKEAMVSAGGQARNDTLFVLMLHTGPKARDRGQTCTTIACGRCEGWQ